MKHKLNKQQRNILYVLAGWIALVLLSIIINILILKSKIPECWHGSVTITSDGEYIDTGKAKQQKRDFILLQIKQNTIMLYIFGAIGIIMLSKAYYEEEV